MRRSAVLLALSLAASAVAQQGPPPGPLTVQIGGVTLRPGGFLEVTGMDRSASTPDSVSTHFGNIPLAATSSQYLASLRNSRLQLESDYTTESLRLTGYLESDFLNTAPAQSDYRWRQYWGRAQFHNWEILGGQAWSLLRPNRRGVASDRDLMNTDVIDAGYHVGLLGFRRRQFRVGRSFGDYKTVFAWETQGNFLAKVAADKSFGHLEATAFTGHRGRRGVTAAGTFTVSQKLRFVTQEYLSRRAAFEALGVVPMDVSGTAALEGLELQAAKRLEVYSYAGLVYASRSTGNRLVREWTIGADHKTVVPSLRAAVLFSAQFSQTGRFAWTGRSGAMNFVMVRMRFILN